MAKKRVVIVGGGFGGIKTALELVEDGRFNVTLLSDHNDFRIYPTLYQVSTGAPADVASISLDEIFAGKAIDIIITNVTTLDRSNRSVVTSDGQSFTYDALVLSLGVQTNYFHIDGLDTYSYGIKTLSDAEKLKAHLHQQLCDDKQPDLNYVVIGGGPTGVELAGALPAYIQKLAKNHGVKRKKVHVDLIEAAPRLVPRMSKDVSKAIARNLRKQGVKVYTKTAVQAQTADALMVNNKPIRSHSVIWTAGVSNHPFFAQNDFQLTRSGKVRVDQFMQAEAGVYVIGDNADTPYSGLAQTAINDAKFVAANLQRIAGGQETKPYIAKKPIYVLPAGPKWAAVVWGRVKFYGILGYWLRSIADLICYHDYLPARQALKRWRQLDDSEETCLHCQGEDAKLKYLSGEA